MSLKAMRATGLSLTMLPLVFLIWWNVVNFMPTGDYPYSVMEEWLIAGLEVVIIVGIAMAMATEGRSRVVGVLMSGVPVVLAGVAFVVTSILPGWGYVPVMDKAALAAGAAVLAVGFYLEFAPRMGFPFRREGGSPRSPKEPPIPKETTPDIEP